MSSRGRRYNTGIIATATVEYDFIAITPKSTLVVDLVRVPSIGQINLFKKLFIFSGNT